MLKMHNAEDGSLSYVDQVQDTGNVDYVKDGEIYRNSPSKSVMVSGSGDLASLTGYNPGTVAYTAGFKAMWQLSASGEWVAI